MKRNVLQVLKATIAVSIVTIVMLLVIAFLLFKFNLSDSAIMVGVYVTYVASCFAGGFIIGKVKGEKKYLWGMVVGLTFFITLSIISLIVTGVLYSDGMRTLSSIAACVVGGALGGMIAKA